MKRSFIKTLFLSLCVLTLIASYDCCELTDPDLTLGEYIIYMDAEVHGMSEGADGYVAHFNNLTTSQVEGDPYFSYVPEKPTPNPFPDLESFKKNNYGSGLLLSWYFSPPVENSNWIRFGFLPNNAEDPQFVFAYWTRSTDGITIPVWPFSLGSWRINKDTITNIIQHPTTTRKDLPTEINGIKLVSSFDTSIPYAISRSWAFSDKLLGFDEIRKSNVEIEKLDWQELDEELITQDGKSVLNITGFDAKKDKAILVNYWVFNPESNDTFFHILNQIEIKVKQR